MKHVWNVYCGTSVHYFEKDIYKKYTVYYAVSNKLVCHSKHSHIEKEREQGWVSMFNVRGRGDVKTTQVCSWFREGLLHPLSNVENIVLPESTSYHSIQAPSELSLSLSLSLTPVSLLRGRVCNPLHGNLYWLTQGQYVHRCAVVSTPGPIFSPRHVWSAFL